METSSRFWPNFKLIKALMYVIVTCKYEIDPIKNSPQKVATLFFPLKVYGEFFRRSRAANSAFSCRIWQEFKLLRALMHVIINYKYKKDRIKKTAEKKWQGNTVFSFITLPVAMGTSGRIWLNFKLIQAIMYVIVTCKYEMDPNKNSQEKWQHRFSHYKSIGIFSDAQGQLTPHSVVRSC